MISEPVGSQNPGLLALKSCRLYTFLGLLSVIVRSEVVFSSIMVQLRPRLWQS